MSDQEALSVLIFARDRVAQGWIQGSSYKTIYMEETKGHLWWKRTDRIPNGTSYCAIGALGPLGVDSYDKKRAKWFLAQAIRKNQSGTDEDFIIDWNDAPGRTKEDVLNAFDRAIELAKDFNEPKKIAFDLKVEVATFIEEPKKKRIKAKAPEPVLDVEKEVRAYVNALPEPEKGYAWYDPETDKQVRPATGVETV